MTFKYQYNKSLIKLIIFSSITCQIINQSANQDQFTNQCSRYELKNIILYLSEKSQAKKVTNCRLQIQ